MQDKFWRGKARATWWNIQHRAVPFTVSPGCVESAGASSTFISGAARALRAQAKRANRQPEVSKSGGAVRGNQDNLRIAIFH